MLPLEQTEPYKVGERNALTVVSYFQGLMDNVKTMQNALAVSSQQGEVESILSSGFGQTLAQAKGFEDFFDSHFSFIHNTSLKHRDPEFSEIIRRYARGAHAALQPYEAALRQLVIESISSFSQKGASAITTQWAYDMPMDSYSGYLSMFSKLSNAQSKKDVAHIRDEFLDHMRDLQTKSLSGKNSLDPEMQFSAALIETLPHDEQRESMIKQLAEAFTLADSAKNNEIGVGRLMRLALYKAVRLVALLSMVQREHPEARQELFGKCFEDYEATLKSVANDFFKQLAALEINQLSPFIERNKKELQEFDQQWEDFIKPLEKSEGPEYVWVPLLKRERTIFGKLLALAEKVAGAKNLEQRKETLFDLKQWSETACLELIAEWQVLFFTKWGIKNQDVQRSFQIYGNHLGRKTAGKMLKLMQNKGEAVTANVALGCLPLIGRLFIQETPNPEILTVIRAFYKGYERGLVKKVSRGTGLNKPDAAFAKAAQSLYDVSVFAIKNWADARTPEEFKSHVLRYFDSIKPHKEFFELRKNREVLPYSPEEKEALFRSFVSACTQALATL